MRVLLDTHVWLWMLVDPERIRAKAREILQDQKTELFLSAASSWEMAVKYQLGKLPLPCPPDEFIPPRLVRDGVVPIPVEHRHALDVARLPDLHRDPFDRLLIAQARIEGLTLFTADEKLIAYDVACVLV